MTHCSISMMAMLIMAAVLLLAIGEVVRASSTSQSSPETLTKSMQNVTAQYLIRFLNKRKSHGNMKEEEDLLRLGNSTQVAHWTQNMTKGTDYEILGHTRYNASLMVQGWDTLLVEPDAERFFASKNEESQLEGYYYGGWMEGCATRVQFALGVQFSFVDTLPKAARQWVEKQFNYIQQMIQLRKDLPNEHYWHQVGRHMEQMRGIADGYTSCRRRYDNSTFKAVTLFDMYALNLGPEWGSIMNHVMMMSSEEEQNLSTTSTSTSTARIIDKIMKTQIPHPLAASKYSKMVQHRRRADGNNKDLHPTLFQHCSALIKATPDGKELFVAQSTWGPISSMRRIYKIYRFQTAVAFSSYPGSISSGDDWYFTSNQIVAQETTNGNMNQTLYRYVYPETVSEFLRVMTACFLANSGEEWTRLFAKENSGTYNNQYMIVDYKRFNPSSASSSSVQDRIPNGTFWLAEQIPGLVERADLSHRLREDSYFPSFNIPYFQRVYNASGFAALEKDNAWFWSWHLYSRHQIFKRNQSQVTDLDSFKALMRYNNYKHDPFSLIGNCTGAHGANGASNNTCSPPYSSTLSIAARGDLMPKNASLGPLGDYVGLQNLAQIDVKIARYSARESLAGVIISGPTRYQQPTFVFSQCPQLFPKGGPPTGMPDVWDFPWIELIP